MKIEIVNTSNNQIQEYATEASAGIYLRANLDCDILLYSGMGSGYVRWLLLE